MIYIHNDCPNPYYNHALEEYLLKNYEEDVFILWINSPAILIGRNQKTENEINPDFVEKEKIQIVRRLSGGGAVYNDQGNLNFTFISKRPKGLEDLSAGFALFAKPVVLALQSLGLPALFSGRNDILLDGKKISGNAQYKYKDKILHHGTLLYNTDMKKLVQALKPRAEKLEAKGVKSVRARVTNIADYLEEAPEILEFKEYLKNYIMDYHEIKEISFLSQEEEKEVVKIQKERFESPLWNCGKPGIESKANLVLKKTFPTANLEAYLQINEGKIEAIDLQGDFFGDKELDQLLKLFLGAEYKMEKLKERLLDIKTEDYISGLTSEELLNFLTTEA